MSKLSEILVKGYKGVTTKGSRYEVIEHVNYKECLVKTHNGTILKVAPQAALSGRFKDPNHPSVHGVGYIGEGDWKPWSNGKKTKEYQLWSAVLMRCYDKRIHLEKPKYEECSICEEWHNFQNFAEWCNMQPNFGKPKYHLDKDLKILGNKIYNPESCTFLPSQVNCLFSNCSFDYKILGVNNYHKDKGWAIPIYAPVFNADTNKTDRTLIGHRHCESEAYYLYKKYKEQHVKDVANFYIDSLDKNVYNNLINWKLADLPIEPK